MLLVGSNALVEHGFDRTPRDWDYIATHDEASAAIKSFGFESVLPNEKGTTLICTGKGRLPHEFMIAWPGSSTEDILNIEGGGVPSLNMLYLIKMSHRYLKNSPHFLKTMRDIREMRLRGAIIEYPDLLKKREKETYDYKHPSLVRDKKAFFDPREVLYKWDHDSIHRAMAIDPLVPAYTKYQPAERKGVMTSKQMFYDLPLEVRLQGVLEEALVLALERSQVPFRGKVHPDKSFRMALMKVCTSITSGWFREFAWEHYEAVVLLYQSLPSYVDTFDRAVDSGIVEPFKGGEM